ncbi:MAG TPA: hypothetical protein VKM00_04750, partial [Luteimonas sp.]|nr:hypothetical protein [Luteimonas sp.]
MFSASDLIDVVSGRGRLRHWLRVGADTPPGEFPPAWKAWFARMGEQLGAITGATADAIIAVLVQRELAKPPRRSSELNRWQAFATLWRQQWVPAEAEERRVRWFAVALTALIHLLLLGILLWLASVRFLVTSRPQGEDVVQVEYVGEGTPEEGAGGAPKSVTPQPPKAAAATPPKPRPVRPVAPAEPAKTAATPATASTPAPSVPTPAPAPAPEQPLQVSQVRIPDSTFVLPPPTPRALEMPKVQVAEPTLQVPIRDIPLAKEPSPPATPQPAPPTPARVVPAPPTPIVAARPAVTEVPIPATPLPPVERPAPPTPATPPAPSPTPAAHAVATTPAPTPST